MTEVCGRLAVAGSPSGVPPRQWIKNTLVLTAPIAAGVAFQPRALLQMLVAVIAFCVAASGIYLVNDAVDAPPMSLTRRLLQHKRSRPKLTSDTSNIPPEPSSRENHCISSLIS